MNLPSLPSALAALPTQTSPGTSQSAKVAQEFEAVFLTQVVQEMFRTVDLGSFGGGQSEEIWRSFMAQAYADHIAELQQTGISQNVENLISAYQRASVTGGEK